MPMLRIRYSEDQIDHGFILPRCGALREYTGSVGEGIAYGGFEFPEKLAEGLTEVFVDVHVLVRAEGLGEGVVVIFGRVVNGFLGVVGEEGFVGGVGGGGCHRGRACG